VAANERAFASEGFQSHPRAIVTPHQNLRPTRRGATWVFMRLRTLTPETDLLQRSEFRERQA
jgi:hypothetical protein